MSRYVEVGAVAVSLRLPLQGSGDSFELEATCGVVLQKSCHLQRGRLVLGREMGRLRLLAPSQSPIQFLCSFTGAYQELCLVNFKF